jgi:cell division transport system permease protein
MNAAARRPGPGRRWQGRLRALRDAHLYGLLSSLGRIGSRPWATLLTVGVIAIALALPLCLRLLLDELGRLETSLRDPREVALFLDPALDEAGAAALAERLRADQRIAAVERRSPEQGLAELASVPDLADALAALDHNPLPPVLLASPTAGVDTAALVAELRAIPGVDLVQHDAEWRRRLGAWLALGQRFADVVALLLALGALLVVGNTVRLDIQGRADEIVTLRLLGATDGFVRRPFLYLGSCYGIAAALLAVALALAVRQALAGPVGDLVSTYHGDFALAPLALRHVGVLFSAALALGWLGAYLAVGHHLRHAEGIE